MSPQAPPLKKVVRIWEGSTEDEIKQNELETTWLKNIEDGKVEQVKLAKRRKEELNLADESGITAMHKSIESWDKTNPPNAILKYLIDCGAYPEYGDRDGVSSRRSRFSKHVPSTSVLTPRSSGSSSVTSHAPAALPPPAGRSEADASP